MAAITYFKLSSPYEGDITKNCALAGTEVDNNFFVLEGRDIQSIEYENGQITITLLNGEKLSTENIINSVTEDCVKDISFDFDDVNGVLTIVQDGVIQTIDGFATKSNPVSVPISVDGSLVGNGLPENPVGISPNSKTGHYRPVKGIVNLIEGEALPSSPTIGDRYITVENTNDYGYLYNYEGVKRIASKLVAQSSPWRIPTKEDWDNMLNAIEPEEWRNHNDPRSNKLLGKFAGKYLKSVNGWTESNTEEAPPSTNCTNEDCHCGDEEGCNPDYCGECGNNHYIYSDSGIDKYGFSALPAGYANEAKDYLYFNDRAYFWTADNHQYRDAYTKIFAYNQDGVIQDIMASDNYMSIRLVKDYTGNNHREYDEILGGFYPTVLMPSLAHDKSIWTSVNISVTDCELDCCHVLPNGGQGMTYNKRFFTNEWTNNGWLKKELSDGESVVAIEEDASTGIKTYTEYRVVNDELIDVVVLVYDKVMAEITPQITEITNEIVQLHTEDERLNQLITLVDGELLTQENTSFDKNTGVLTLKSKNGTNDVQVQFSFNFGNF